MFDGSVRCARFKKRFWGDACAMVFILSFLHELDAAFLLQAFLAMGKIVQ